jgi:hypothetical protein
VVLGSDLRPVTAIGIDEQAAAGLVLGQAIEVDCVVTGLDIAYPVGRSGSKFEALLPTSLLGSVDLMAVRYFVVLDDSGNRYPAVIEHVSESSAGETDFVAIRGVVVTNMS